MRQVFCIKGPYLKKDGYFYSHVMIGMVRQHTTKARNRTQALRMAQKWVSRQRVLGRGYLQQSGSD